MKISELKQPYRRMAEYLAEKNANPHYNNNKVLKKAFSWAHTNYPFWDKVNEGECPQITKQIKKNFPPDFDFSEEEVVNTNPFSVDGLSLNQIAMRIFRKNFMDLELWEQGLVYETFEQNVIAKNSIIELPNNLIIQNRIYTQLAREGKFDQLPDTCEFSEPVELEVGDDDVSKNFRRITGKFKGNYMDIHCIGWNYAQLPTPKIDFSEFKAGDVVEVELVHNETRIGWFDFTNETHLYIRILKRKGNQICNGGSCAGTKIINKEKIKSIKKLK